MDQKRAGHSLAGGIAAVVLGLSPGCIDVELDAEEAEAGGAPPARGTFIVSPPEYQPTAEDSELRLAAQSRWLFYLNRNGGTFRPGFDNSVTDRSSILQETSTVPGWNVPESDWQTYVSCVRNLFTDYLVDIVTEDPGQADHIEAVVGGTIGNLNTQDLPVMDDVPGGVSPFTRDCSTIKNSIVFVFPEVYDDDYQRVCEVTAQEIAHSFGLDHEILCEDPMSYDSGCRGKTFQDQEAPCGELTERSCAGAEYDCQRDTQNSVELLSLRVGRVDGTRAATPEVMGTCSTATATSGSWPWLLPAAAVLLRRRRRTRPCGRG